MKPKILLIGLGSLGGVLLELLARETRIGEIICSSRDPARGEARCNLARLSAVAQGCEPRIQFVPLDLTNIEAVAELISRIVPDIVISTASMQTWWLPDLLPEAERSQINRAGFGMWLPVHLSLSLKLMKALRVANYTGHSLIAPYPDVANPVLGRLGLAPTCGIGNLDEIVAKIRFIVAGRIEVSPADVVVYFVAHHALEKFVFSDPSAVLGTSPSEVPPYFLRVEYKGQDITHAVGAELILMAPFPLTPGPATHFLTAGSAIRLIRMLISPRGGLVHVPGPNGLPGGYPMVASSEGVRPALLQGLTMDEAIKINEASHRFDGIDRIEEDGMVVFSPESVQIFSDTLGYKYDRMPVDQIEGQAYELIRRFQELADRLGVSLPMVNIEGQSNR